MPPRTVAAQAASQATAAPLPPRCCHSDQQRRSSFRGPQRPSLLPARRPTPSAHCAAYQGSAEPVGDGGGVIANSATRRLACSLAVGAAATFGWQRSARARSTQPGVAETFVPLVWREGAFCLRFSLSDSSRASSSSALGSTFWGVADTGSPFLLVAQCERRDCPAYCERWGCYRGEGKASDLADTVEVYVSGESKVQWRQGVACSFPDAEEQRGRSSATTPAVLRAPRWGGAAASGGRGPSPDGGATSGSGLRFGVQSGVVGSGGTGSGVFFGLIRDRSRDIRPTFLEQTPFVSVGMDLREVGREALSLSASHRLSARGDVLELVDPRVWGDPVRHYSAVASVFRVGGNELQLQGDGSTPPRPRRVLCIFDTGTTGISMTQGLFDNYWSTVRRTAAAAQARDPRASGTFTRARRVEVGFKLVSGNELTLDMVNDKHPAFRPGLDLVTPIEEIAWADIGDPASLAGYCAIPPPEKGGPTKEEDIPVACQGRDVNRPFDDIAFLGLGFLVGRNMTIDVDANRLAISPRLV